MATKRVRFTESAYLPPMPEGTVMAFRAGVDLLGLEPATFVGPPGIWTPERIGREVNRLRDEGYDVEVIHTPEPGGEQD